jgi:hypothetical protein
MTSGVSARNDHRGLAKLQERTENGGPMEERPESGGWGLADGGFSAGSKRARFSGPTLACRVIRELVFDNGREVVAGEVASL